MYNMAGNNTLYNSRQMQYFLLRKYTNTHLHSSIRFTINRQPGVLSYLLFRSAL
jgi:CDP-diacylglycerol pyrophosphatase